MMLTPKPNKIIIKSPLPKSHRVVIRYLGHSSTPTNPYRPGYGYHSGTDFYGALNNGLGDPVVSIADGVVVNSSPVLSARGYGNMVVVWHPQLKVWSRYAHLQSRLVKEGDKIKAGQKIATLGTSGTDNAHLHFDIIKKELGSNWRAIPQDGGFSKTQVMDAFINPEAFFRRYGVTL